MADEMDVDSSTQTDSGLLLLSSFTPEAPRDARTDSSCRKCDSTFNIFFPSRQCHHCGYLYCGPCSNHQALKPVGETASGYELKNVCSYCIVYLAVTAGGKPYLRTQSVSKLREYMLAYNIKLKMNAVEKDDYIDAIIKARGPNGCLPEDKEKWYRLNGVPSGQAPRNQNSNAAATEAIWDAFRRGVGGSWRDQVKEVVNGLQQDNPQGMGATSFNQNRTNSSLPRFDFRQPNTNSPSQDAQSNPFTMNVPNGGFDRPSSGNIFSTFGGPFSSQSFGGQPLRNQTQSNNQPFSFGDQAAAQPPWNFNQPQSKGQATGQGSRSPPPGSTGEQRSNRPQSNGQPHPTSQPFNFQSSQPFDFQSRSSSQPFNFQPRPATTQPKTDAQTYKRDNGPRASQQAAPNGSSNTPPAKAPTTRGNERAGPSQAHASQADTSSASNQGRPRPQSTHGKTSQHTESAPNLGSIRISTQTTPDNITPNMNEILEMSEEKVRKMSVSQLKAILKARSAHGDKSIENVLEKSELVKLVLEVVNAQKKDMSDYISVARERERLARVLDHKHGQEKTNTSTGSASVHKHPTTMEDVEDSGEGCTWTNTPVHSRTGAAAEVNRRAPATDVPPATSEPETALDIFYCTPCDRYFSSKMQLKHHQDEHHANSQAHAMSCPICEQICDVPVHLKEAAQHRSPTNTQETNDTTDWPKSCQVCNTILNDPEARLKHIEQIQSHLKITSGHGHQSGSTDTDEWQHLCWPCDLYFANENELSSHRESCNSPLMYMTRMEGEILNAFLQERRSRDGGTNAVETVMTAVNRKNQNRELEGDHDASPVSANNTTPTARKVRSATSTNDASTSPSLHECPLCLENETNLGNIPCGHVFCLPCLTQVIERAPVCPICSAPAGVGDIRKVYLS